jgi:hypothetical protein
MTFAAPGTYTIFATYSGDANHYGSGSPAVNHRVEDAAPTAGLSGSGTICSGSSATLRVELTGQSPWRLTWSDGLVETTTSAVHLRSVNPQSTTTYTLTSVTDGTSATVAVAGSATVTVTAVPAPAILNAGTAATPGQPLILRATPGYDSYRWSRNGVEIAGESGPDLTIPAVTAAHSGSYTVVGLRDGCFSASSASYALVLLGLPTNDDAVIPLVGNVRGAGGSLFRTTVHLVNSTDEIMQGELTFIDRSLAAVPYRLSPGEIRFIDSLLPVGYAGLTSANVRRLSGPLPVVVAHVFNDGGAAGTSGLIQRAIPVQETLVTGDRAVLIAPLDAVATRFNVGIRSLEEGMSVRIVRRTAGGALLGSFVRELGPSSLTHEPLSAITASAPLNSESLTFEILAGRGVIYGAATDNGTNDPNMQIASRLGASRSGRYILPVAGSVSGLFDSRFSTGLQLHNPSDQPLQARLTFTAGTAGGTAPAIDVTVAPGATLAYADLVAAIGGSGFGSVEVTTSSLSRPVLLARVYSIGALGEASLMMEPVAETDVLRTGDQGVIAAPHFISASRLNIGIRTLDTGVRVRITVRNAAGAVLTTLTRTFGPALLTQSSAVALLGLPLAGDESITFTVEEGSAIVYGTWTDNVTQDPALQLAVRP